MAVNNGSNNRPDSPFFSRRGLLQVWRIQDARLVKAAEITTGRWSQGVAWSSDSRTILLQSMVEKEIEVFGFDGGRLRRDGVIALPAGPSGIGTAEPLRPATIQNRTPKPVPAPARTGDRP